MTKTRKPVESQESTGGSFWKEPEISRIYGNIIKDIRPKPASRMRIYAKSQSPNPPQEPRPSTSMANSAPKQPVTGKPINEYRNLRNLYTDSRRYKISTREKVSHNIGPQLLNSLNFSYQSPSPRLGTAVIGVSRKRTGTSVLSYRF